MSGPIPQEPGVKKLALQHHSARVGEVIKWNGRYWRAVSKNYPYTGFELCADRIREGV